MEFDTKNNAYCWDNNVGIFIPFTKETHESNDMASTCKFLGKNTFSHTNWLKKWDKIPQLDSNDTYKLSLDDLKDNIFRFGLSQLTLEVTEDCNFRCEFCVFSDNYDNTRTHSKNYMKLSTAKKAIDYYFNLLKENSRYNPLRKPVVGFYGGEPLLNFELIKECVRYIKSKYGNETTFTMTTNGSLMNEEIGNWLMKNYFRIVVSLNGPEKEHDRLRKYPDGKGTFKNVVENMRHIVDNDYENISTAFVYDYHTDLFACEEFFNQENIPGVTIVSLVSDTYDSHYFERFSEEDVSNFLSEFEKAQAYYFSYISTNHLEDKVTLFDRLFSIPIHNNLNTCTSLYSPSPLMPFTATCIPGKKLFIDVHGKIHICERVNPNFPIGDVYNGLNFEQIYELIRNYQKNMDKCLECKVSKICDKCYVPFMAEKKFIPSSKICEKTEEISKELFIRNFEILEKHQKFIDSLKYQNPYEVE